MSNSHRGAIEDAPIDDRRTDSQTSSGPIAGTLTAFQRDCLVAIASYRPAEWPATRRPFSQPGQPHGLSIMAVLEEARPEDIKHGRLYPNLDELVEKGLVAKHEIDLRTNGYTLTETGRDVLRERRGAYARALDAGKLAAEGE